MSMFTTAKAWRDTNFWVIYLSDIENQLPLSGLGNTNQSNEQKPGSRDEIFAAGAIALPDRRDCQLLIGSLVNFTRLLPSACHLDLLEMPALSFHSKLFVRKYHYILRGFGHHIRPLYM